MTFAPSLARAIAARFGRLAVVCGAALLLLGTGWAVGTRQAYRHLARAPSSTDLDHMEARIQSLEFAASHDASAEQFRAARAMILDLGREIDALRNEAKSQDARVERRLDRVERQTSDATPSASIPAASVDSAPATIVPPPAPALPARVASPTPASDLVVTQIYRQHAIVEGTGGLWRVAVGDDLPGLGRVESIEPRGAGWAVVTANGTITSPAE